MLAWSSWALNFGLDDSKSFLWLLLGAGRFGGSRSWAQQLSEGSIAAGYCFPTN